jgi:hypothetical protein
MAKHADPIGTEIIRPAQRAQAKKTTPPHKVAGPVKAFLGPRTLGQALDQAVSPRRRREIVEQSGYDAHAQKLTFEPMSLTGLIVSEECKWDVGLGAS